MNEFKNKEIIIGFIVIIILAVIALGLLIKRGLENEKETDIVITEEIREQDYKEEDTEAQEEDTEAQAQDTEAQEQEIQNVAEVIKNNEPVSKMTEEEAENLRKEQ